VAFDDALDGLGPEPVAVASSRRLSEAVMVAPFFLSRLVS